MKNDVRIVKELPARLQSLDLEEIGSQVGASALFYNFRHLFHDSAGALCSDFTLALVSDH
jgi:hypothetical protein